HRLALVVFAARAQVVCPLTRDYDHFREALEKVDPGDSLLEIGPGPSGPASGTRLGEGLKQAVAAHDERFRGHQDILMLSDGDDPDGDDEWQKGVDAAREQGIPVHTIGIGDPETGGRILLKTGYLQYEGQTVWTRLHEKPLSEIARLTHGSYTPARTKDILLGRLFIEEIEPRSGREDTEDILPIYRQRYPWFLATALALLSL